MVRIVVAAAGLLWGLQFLLLREQWTRLLARTAPDGTPAWFAPTFPYIGFAIMIPWSIIALTGFFGTF